MNLAMMFNDVRETVAVCCGDAGDATYILCWRSVGLGKGEVSGTHSYQIRLTEWLKTREVKLYKTVELLQRVREVMKRRHC